MAIYAGDLVGFFPITYFVDEETDEKIEVCVRLYSTAAISEQVITLSTYNGTASGNNIIQSFLTIILTIKKNTTAPMDYTALVDEVLVFPAGSVQGDEMCVNISINNDNVLEMTRESFFVNISSNNANIAPGQDSALIYILDSDSGMYYAVNVLLVCSLY